MTQNGNYLLEEALVRQLVGLVARALQVEELALARLREASLLLLVFDGLFRRPRQIGVTDRSVENGRGAENPSDSLLGVSAISEKMIVHWS